MIDVIRRYWTLKNNRQQKAHIKWAIQACWYTLIDIKITICGGEIGIRTLETLLTLTHFPGVLLQPLGHLTVRLLQIIY